LQACATVDEAKNIMDKTAALSAYARQVNDKDMECWLAEMKMRAMRRVGELTSEIKTTQGARNELSTSGGTKSKTEQLKAAGLTKQTVGRYEKLAKVPEDEFETVINAAKKKTESVTFASFSHKSYLSKQITLLPVTKLVTLGGSILSFFKLAGMPQLITEIISLMALSVFFLASIYCSPFTPQLQRVNKNTSGVYLLFPW